jgi:hypothetical protein
LSPQQTSDAGHPTSRQSDRDGIKAVGDQSNKAHPVHTSAGWAFFVFTLGSSAE